MQLLLPRFEHLSYQMKSVGCWPSFGLRNIRSSRPVQMCKMYASRKRAWQRQTRRQCLYLHFFPNTEFTVAMLIFPISDDLQQGSGEGGCKGVALGRVPSFPWDFSPLCARVWQRVGGCLVPLRQTLPPPPSSGPHGLLMVLPVAHHHQHWQH